MSKNLKAFVLMPFDPEFKAIYEDLIRPALEEVGYDVKRADSFLDQQNILRDIVRGIASADLILADLTSLSPNVLYELGLCHGLQIPTILLAQSMDDVPFDLRSYRIQIYSVRFDEAHKLKQSLKEIGEKHARGEIVFGSPIKDFLAPETYSRKADSLEIVERKTIENPPEKVEEEKGFLDFLVEGAGAAENVGIVFSEMTKDTTEIAGKLKNHGERMQSLTQNPGPGVASQVYRIALTLSTDLNDYSEKIEGNLPKLQENIGILTESYLGYINWVELKSEQEREGAIEFRKSIVFLLDATRSGLVEERVLRDGVAGLKGISKEITRSSRRLTQCLDNIISAMEKVEAFCVKTLTLIDEKLEKKF